MVEEIEADHLRHVDDRHLHEVDDRLRHMHDEVLASAAEVHHHTLDDLEMTEVRLQDDETTDSLRSSCQPFEVGPSRLKRREK